MKGFKVNDCRTHIEKNYAVSVPAIVVKGFYRTLIRFHRKGLIDTAKCQALLSQLGSMFPESENQDTPGKAVVMISNPIDTTEGGQP